MTCRALMLALALVWIPLTPEAQSLKLAVAVRHTGEDQVGARLAYRLRESIRGSRGFFLADEDHAVAIISLISIDRECAAKGSGSSVAIIYLNHSAQYMMGSVVTVGRDMVDLTAEETLASLDQHSQAFRR